MKKASTETIGQYRESSLHAEVKSLYAREGDVCEAPLGGFYVDVLRPDMVVEVQTSSFGAIRRKAETLAPERRFRLVHPVAALKTIATHAESGERLRLKKSPKKCGVFDLFDNLVNAATLPLLPGFELELLLVSVEETRVEDGKGSWRRRGTSILDKRLVAVLESRLFREPADYLALLPASLGAEFTSTELAAAAGIRRPLAMKACYCLRAMGAIEERGKRGRSKLYAPRLRPPPRSRP